MLNGKLLTALNNQLKFEFESSHTYLAMAAYCLSEDFEGFANFFKAQAEEERMHAMKFFDFINNKGEKIVIKGLDEPESRYESIIDVFMKAYEHERAVSKSIYALADIALEEKEHSTLSFLQWFITEQVEEEGTFDLIVKKLKRAENNNAALFILDAELGQRGNTPVPI